MGATQSIAAMEFPALPGPTCDNTPNCGASVARDVSKLLGTGITNFVPLLNLSAFD
jgi:hypothetical protein